MDLQTLNLLEISILKEIKQEMYIKNRPLNLNNYMAADPKDSIMHCKCWSSVGFLHIMQWFP